MRADNTAHLLAAAQRRADRTRRRALDALRRLDAAGGPVTFEALAREAGVSRSWLYNQPDLRTEIDRIRAHRQPSAPAPSTPERQRATAESLLRRLQVATDRIRRLETDNQQLRDALARALGDARTTRITTAATRPDDTTRHPIYQPEPRHRDEPVKDTVHQA